MQLLYNILILLDVLASILESLQPIILSESLILIQNHFRIILKFLDIVSEFLSSFNKHNNVNNVKFQRKLQKYEECKASGSLRSFFGLISFNLDLKNLQVQLWHLCCSTDCVSVVWHIIICFNICFNIRCFDSVAYKMFSLLRYFSL